MRRSVTVLLRPAPRAARYSFRKSSGSMAIFAAIRRDLIEREQLGHPAVPHL
jgi:hypothetical protein